MSDRWPYPISQTMQRQTGSRVKPLPVPDTPPIAPDADKEDKQKSIEPTKHRAVESHSE